MKRILVTSDFHIDERFDLDQIERLLSTVVEEANKRDELWLLGDMSHDNQLSARVLYLLVSFLTKIKVPIRMIGGNHDEADGTVSTLDWIPLVFPTIQFTRDTQQFECEGLKILLGHFNVEESVMGAYDFKLKSGVSLGDLGVDLACLGHIHKQQIIKGHNITAFHPGSLFYQDIGERNDKKSLTELILDNGKFELNLIPLDPDPIVQLEVKPEDDISEILAKLPLTARVRIVVHYSDPLLIKKDVSKKYDNYNFRDKKVIFQFEDSKKTLEQRVKMSHQGMIQLDEFLKRQDTSVANLIKKYLKETR